MGMRTATSWSKALAERSLPAGGFAAFPGKAFDLESTAWAVLALHAGDHGHGLIAPACRRLGEAQGPEGFLAAAGVAGACWPTALGVLAWKKTGGFEAETDKAVAFLLAARGNHPAAAADSPTGHDLSLQGWPWNMGTHSWVEPTALAILALRAAGREADERVSEGVRMLLDRQLPRGGWNYGNTTVFDRELHPMPANTGQALCALAGIARETEVRRSIAYSETALGGAATPFSFCWGLFGLRAWDVPVEGIPERIEAIIARQGRYGPYATPLLAMLALAREANGGLLDYLLADPRPAASFSEG